MTASILLFLPFWMIIHDLNRSFWHLRKHFINSCDWVCFISWNLCFRFALTVILNESRYYNTRKTENKIQQRHFVLWSVIFPHFYISYVTLWWLEEHNGIKNIWKLKLKAVVLWSISHLKKWTGTINLTIVWTTYYCSLKSFLEPWCCHKWFPWEYIHFKLLNCILAFEIKFGSQGWSLYSGAYSFSHLLPALIHNLYLHIILLAIIICALNLCTSRLEIHGCSVSVYYLCMKT